MILRAACRSARTTTSSPRSRRSASSELFWRVALRPGQADLVRRPRRARSSSACPATRSRRWSRSCCSRARRCRAAGRARRARDADALDAEPSREPRPRRGGPRRGHRRRRHAARRPRPARRARTSSARCSAPTGWRIVARGEGAVCPPAALTSSDLGRGYPRRGRRRCRLVSAVSAGAGSSTASGRSASSARQARALLRATADEPRRDLRRASRRPGSIVQIASKRRSRSAGRRARRARLLPGQQAGGVARRVDDHGPLVGERVVRRDRQLDRAAVRSRGRAGSRRRRRAASASAPCAGSARSTVPVEALLLEGAEQHRRRGVRHRLVLDRARERDQRRACAAPAARAGWPPGDGGVDRRRSVAAGRRGAPLDRGRDRQPAVGAGRRPCAATSTSSVGVAAVARGGALRAREAVALLPHADRAGRDAGLLRDVLDGETVHVGWTAFNGASERPPGTGRPARGHPWRPRTYLTQPPRDHPAHRRHRLRRRPPPPEPARRRPRRARCLVRDPERATRRPRSRVVKGDVLSGEGLDEALDGVDVAYYLVHSMGRGRRRRLRRARPRRAAHLRRRGRRGRRRPRDLPRRAGRPDRRRRPSTCAAATRSREILGEQRAAARLRPRGDGDRRRQRLVRDAARTSSSACR